MRLAIAGLMVNRSEEQSRVGVRDLLEGRRLIAGRELLDARSDALDCIGPSGHGREEPTAGPLPPNGRIDLLQLLDRLGVHARGEVLPAVVRDEEDDVAR